MIMNSKVSNRFARTEILSKMRNPSASSKETTFLVVLPAAAFITGFTMEIQGKNYTALVEEKAKAIETYSRAVARGTSAAYVAVRDANRFEINVNIERSSTINFYLTYEELLNRNEFYELVLNFHSVQHVKELKVTVSILVILAKCIFLNPFSLPS